MNFRKYKSYLLIGVFFSLVGGFFFVNYFSSMESILTAGGILMKNVGQKMFNPVVPKANLSTPVSIENIISERFLYTLSKIIEEKISILSNASIGIESKYESYDVINLVGTNFVFTVHNKKIELPVSSYYFDIWNKKPTKSISGEIAIHTGIVNQNPKKVIALTFDDGPSKKYTHILLDILKQENIHATFYVLGSRVDEFPDILKREYAEGHEIGNHSYSHSQLTKLSDKMMQEELYKTDQAIYRAIGIYPTTFRPPYGSVDTGVLEKAAMPAILWSIDPHDWRTHSIIRNTSSIAHASDGDILIMHDIHEASVASVPVIIKKLRDQGFAFVTISELLSLSETNTQIGKICTKQGKCK